MTVYKAIFDGLESTLFTVGSRMMPADQIRKRLEPYKQLEGKRFSDEDYYWIIGSFTLFSTLSSGRRL